MLKIPPQHNGLAQSMCVRSAVTLKWKLANQQARRIDMQIQHAQSSNQKTFGSWRKNKTEAKRLNAVYDQLVPTISDQD